MDRSQVYSLRAIASEFAGFRIFNYPVGEKPYFKEKTGYAKKK